MKTRPALATVSILCSTPSVLLAIVAFLRYWYFEAPHSGEDVLGLGIVSLWVLPLLVVVLGLGLLAWGFRLICAAVALVPFLFWSSIMYLEGSFL